MNNILAQLKKDLEKITMTENEKTYRRGAILAYIKEKEETPKEEPKSPYFPFSILTFSRRVVRVTVFALIFMLTLGTGLAQASEEALPGEILYPVKITAEDITAFFTSSSEDKIDWEIERTNRRMEEVVKLALREKLDEHIQKELAQKIQKHTQAITAEIQKIEEADPSEALSAHADLATSIEAHNEVLLAIKEGIKETKELTNDDEVGKNIEKIIEVTTEEGKKATESKEKNKEKIVEEDGDTSAPTKETKLEKIRVLQAKIGHIETEMGREKDVAEEVVEGIVTEETAVIVTEEDISPEVVQEDVQPREEVTPDEGEDDAEGEHLEVTSLAVSEEATEGVAGSQTADQEGVEILPTAQEMQAIQTVISQGVAVDQEEAYINSLKEQAQAHIQKHEYGRAIIALEELYQYLSKQVIIKQIKEKVVDSEKAEIEITNAEINKTAKQEEEVAETESVEDPLTPDPIPQESQATGEADEVKEEV